MQFAAQLDDLDLVLRAHINFHDPLLGLRGPCELQDACLGGCRLLKFALNLEEWRQICKSAVTSHRDQGQSRVGVCWSAETLIEI
jgi:hypothetical protein